MLDVGHPLILGPPPGQDGADPRELLPLLPSLPCSARQPRHAAAFVSTLHQKPGSSITGRHVGPWLLPQAQQQRRSRPVAPASAAAASAAAPALDSLDFYPVLTVQGFIMPEVPEGTEVGACTAACAAGHLLLAQPRGAAVQTAVAFTSCGNVAAHGCTDLVAA